MLFWFNGFVVVGVGAAGTLAQNLALCYLTDEQHMTSQIQLFPDFTGEHCIGVFGEIINTVTASFHPGEGGELIHIPSRLHSEMPDGLKGHILRQDADVELPGLFDQLPGIVTFLHRHADPGRLRGHLDRRVGDTAVVPLSLGGQDKQAVSQISER